MAVFLLLEPAGQDLLQQLICLGAFATCVPFATNKVTWQQFSFAVMSGADAHCQDVTPDHFCGVWVPHARNGI